MTGGKSSADGSADMVLLHGMIITMDAQNAIVEALAIKGNRIIAVGSTTDIQALAGPATTVIELQQRAVVPGFTDVHVHFINAGLRALREFKIPSASIAEALKTVRSQAQRTPDGEWLIGGDIRFAHVKFAEKRWPTRWELDAVAPNHLVYLHFGPHIKVVNSRVLALAQITAETPDPVGGTIVKDPCTGEPTGVLRETAAHVIRQLWPPYTFEDHLAAIKLEGQRCLTRGVTTIHDIIVNPLQFQSYQELYHRGELPLRVRLLFRIVEADFDLETLLGMGLTSNFGDAWLRVGGTKMSVGGGISGSNAALYEAYADEPDNYGVIRIPQDRLTTLIARCNRHGLQCHVHALGDKDLDLTLDAFTDVARSQSITALRHRVEHAGNWFFTPERRRRFRDLGLIAVPNINFLATFGDGVLVTLGPDRLATDVFPLKSMLAEDMLLVSGTDGPELEPSDALRDIGTAILRRTEHGVPLDPTEAISIMDGLRMFTINPAYVAFEEAEKGSLEPWKLADLVVLAENPLTTSPERLHEILVDMTILDGKIVYRRDGI